MLEVKIPSEIKDYKGKLILGLNVRQVISLVGALCVGVPIGVFGSDKISPDILPWIVIIAAAPILMWGFVPFQGMRFEEYVPTMYHYYVLPQARVYEDIEVNYFAHISSEIRERDIRIQRMEEGDYDDEEEYYYDEEYYDKDDDYIDER